MAELQHRKIGPGMDRTITCMLCYDITLSIRFLHKQATTIYQATAKETKYRSVIPNTHK